MSCNTHQFYALLYYLLSLTMATYRNRGIGIKVHLRVWTRGLDPRGLDLNYIFINCSQVTAFLVTSFVTKKPVSLSDTNCRLDDRSNCHFQQFFFLISWPEDRSPASLLDSFFTPSDWTRHDCTACGCTPTDLAVRSTWVLPGFDGSVPGSLSM